MRHATTAVSSSSRLNDLALQGLRQVKPSKTGVCSSAQAALEQRDVSHDHPATGHVISGALQEIQLQLSPIKSSSCMHCHILCVCKKGYSASAGSRNLMLFAILNTATYCVSGLPLSRQHADSALSLYMLHRPSHFSFLPVSGCYSGVMPKNQDAATFTDCIVLQAHRVSAFLQ